MKNARGGGPLLPVTSNDSIDHLWNLPEEVLFLIVSFVAAPTRRAHVLCHQLAPLCKSAYNTLLQDSQESSARLWDIVLQQDYSTSHDETVKSTRRRTDGCSSSTNCTTTKRRECKRLRRSSLQKVHDAHVLMIDHTEICYYYLSELANTKNLTRAKLVRLLHEYGPQLRLNAVVSSGGLFLVEVCRARHVKESAILKCVQELIEQHGAMVNLHTCEPPTRLNALAVASVRGMTRVVKYLLQQCGADPNIRSSGRFRLHTNPKKSLRCDNVTPLEFATSMMQAERNEGATERNLHDLAQCVRLLEEASAGV